MGKNRLGYCVSEAGSGNPIKQTTLQWKIRKRGAPREPCQVGC